MKGDFSKWDSAKDQNFSGVLLQQGRVLIDSDWNAQTQIDIDWKDLIVRDAIGTNVAAVPV